MKRVKPRARAIDGGVRAGDPSLHMCQEIDRTAEKGEGDLEISACAQEGTYEERATLPFERECV